MSLFILCFLAELDPNLRIHSADYWFTVNKITFWCTDLVRAVHNQVIVIWWGFQLVEIRYFFVLTVYWHRFHILWWWDVLYSVVVCYLFMNFNCDYRGKIQTKTWCMGSYMLELTKTSPYAHSRADIQRRGSILAWIVILSVYAGEAPLAEVKLLISPFLRWSLDLWNQLLGFK
jgi:hypothetical protein